MSKEKIITITQINIKLKDKEISLSSEDARKIYQELQKLFELEKNDFEKLKEEWEKTTPQTPVYPYYPPIIIERWPRIPYWELPYTVTTYETSVNNPLDIGCMSDPTIRNSNCGGLNGQTLSIDLNNIK